MTTSRTPRTPTRRSAAPTPARTTSAQPARTPGDEKADDKALKAEASSPAPDKAVAGAQPDQGGAPVKERARQADAKDDAAKDDATQAAKAAVMARVDRVAGKAAHTDVPDQSGDFISPWNGARLKCIQNPHPELETLQTHVMTLPELCPASQNPLPGSSLTIRYRGKRRFLEVFSLSAYVQASIGHPMVRDVEALTQAVAIDCANALGQKVEVDGLFVLRGLAQTVMTEVIAKPRRDERSDKAHKADRAARASKAEKVQKADKSARLEKARKDADKDRKKARR